jgi:hypothetical protein
MRQAIAPRFRSESAERAGPVEVVAEGNSAQRFKCGSRTANADLRRDAREGGNGLEAIDARDRVNHSGGERSTSMRRQRRHALKARSLKLYPSNCSVPRGRSDLVRVTTTNGCFTVLGPSEAASEPSLADVHLRVTAARIVRHHTPRMSIASVRLSRGFLMSHAQFIRTVSAGVRRVATQIKQLGSQTVLVVGPLAAVQDDIESRKIRGVRIEPGVHVLGTDRDDASIVTRGPRPP